MEKEYLEYCTINFCNKSMNDIKFSKIFSSNQSYFPINNLSIKKAFKYNKTMGRMIFNYNTFSKELVESPDENLCICNSDEYSNFIDKDLGHIVTGNLDIVKDHNLKRIMSFGTKFRIPICLNHNSIHEGFLVDLDKFIYKVAIKYNMPLISFQEWKNYVYIDFIHSLNMAYSDYSKFQENITHKQLSFSIKNIKDKFIITYIDKVNNNYAIMCKFFYNNYIMKHVSNSGIYECVPFKEREIFNRIKAIYKTIGIHICKINFPYLILIPKFHKNPIKFRTVTCGYNSYLVKANKDLLNIINKIFDYIQSIEKTAIIKNSFQLVTILSEVKSCVNMKSFDFEDLFNSIDIKDLIEIMNTVFQIYQVHTIINISKYNALIGLVIKENYCFNGFRISKQVKGIPMGGGASSALADLYLHMYEKIRRNIEDQCLYRYVDDVFVYFLDNNDNMDFSFYPKNLILKDTCNNASNPIEFLDLSLKIIDSKIAINIYDKRDNYCFQINKLQFWNSSLHISVFRNILLNQLIRIRRICNSKEHIIQNITALLTQASKNGYPNEFIIDIFNKFKCFSKIFSIRLFFRTLNN